MDLCRLLRPRERHGARVRRAPRAGNPWRTGSGARAVRSRAARHRLGFAGVDPCPFCEIVDGRRAQEIVASTDGVVAFLCEPPATPGHTLIVPRRHRADIWDVDPAEMAESMELARRLA
ncbi:MAG: HIT domain-containing protein, partial [Actinobacteria bacterium]